MPCFKEPLHSKFELGVKCLICQIPIHVICMTANPTQICTDLSYLLSMRVCCHGESLWLMCRREIRMFISAEMSVLWRVLHIQTLLFLQTSSTSHWCNVFLSSRKQLMTRLLPNCLFRVKRVLSQEGYRATGQNATCFVIAGCVHVKSIWINWVIEKWFIVDGLRLIIAISTV